MKIEEIMTRGQVVTVPAGAPLKLAAQRLEHRISGLPDADVVAVHSEPRCTNEHAAVMAAETRR